MHKIANLRNAAVHLFVETEAGEVIVKVAIGKPGDAEALHSDNVALIIEDADGALLTPTQWPRFGLLPETATAGAAAHARFGFANPHLRPLKRAIAVVRGDFGEVALDG